MLTYKYSDYSTNNLRGFCVKGENNMYHDSVTGLPALESFLDFTEKMWTTSGSGRFALLSVNIGSFHKFNQHYGYAQGDVLLSLFAQRLIRNSEHILSGCREKADFFLLLLDKKEINLSHIEDYLRTIFAEFKEEISSLYPAASLSFNIGICLLSEGVHSLTDAFQYATYARKSLESSFKGSDISIAFYQDALLGKTNCEHRILPLFEDIMINNHFILYLQPKFDLDTSNIIGAEALVRIMDSNGKLLKPNIFLPVLEKYNLAYELDLLVMESILKLVSHWKDAALAPLPISVNLSEHDFSNLEFMKIFRELMDKYPDLQEYLEFEITESSMHRNPDYMLEAISQIHQMGCKISLDGFGKEVLSINTLGIPPVDAVKFDKSVLITSMRGGQNMHVLKRLAEMFDDCEIPVICEGIENESEESFIKECGIHFVQGYYYGRPVPIDLFEKKYMIYEFTLSLS